MKTRGVCKVCGVHRVTWRENLFNIRWGLNFRRGEMKSPYWRLPLETRELYEPKVPTLRVEGAMTRDEALKKLKGLEEENRQLKAKLLEFLEGMVDELPEEYRGIMNPSIHAVKKEFGL